MDRLLMSPYLRLLHDAMAFGERRPDRTGTGTRSLFGEQVKFDLTDGFPLLSRRKIHTRSLIHELLWLVSGQTNIDYLRRNKVTIWDEWADENGDLGPVYGKQWRKWVGQDGTVHDQLATAVTNIKHNPYSRRHVVSAWNVADLHAMRLEPCHIMFQFYAHVDGRLSCHMYQRSADLFLGVPYNIASYSILTHMVAQVTGRKPGVLTVSFGDVHLYENHTDQAALLLSRDDFAPPTLHLNPDVQHIDGFEFGDFRIDGYECHPHIPAPVAV